MKSSVRLFPTSSADVDRLKKVARTRLTAVTRNPGLVTLAIILIAGSMVSRAFGSLSNQISVLRQVSVLSVLATGQCFVIIGGGIDLSVGGVIGALVMLAAVLQNLPLPVTALVVVLSGALLGGINGIIVAWGRVAPFIVTFGMSTIAQGLAFLIGNGRPIFLEGEAHKSVYAAIGSGTLAGIPMPAVIAICIALVCQFILRQTPIGVYIRGIGGNEDAVLYSGVEVWKPKTMTYVFSGVLGGLSALLAMSRMLVGDPVIGQGMALDSIACVVLGGTYMGGGGRGSMFAPLLGAYTIGLLNNLLNMLNVSAYWQMVAKGCVVIGAVYTGTRKIAR